MRRIGCNATHNEDPAYYDYPWYCTLPYGHGDTHKAGDSSDHRKFYYEWEATQ